MIGGEDRVRHEGLAGISNGCVRVLYQRLYSCSFHVDRLSADGLCGRGTCACPKEGVCATCVRLLQGRLPVRMFLLKFCY